MLTQEQVAKALPSTLKSAVTQELVDRINNIALDPLIAEEIRNNFLTYARVIQEGRFKTEDYLNAVTYVTYKLMGLNNQESYFRTFPQRHADLVAKGTSAKDIGSFVTSYHKGKLVNLIMEQTLVPVWIVNQDVYQKAINVQADLMVNAVSEKVRSDAANSILTHLAKPKDAAAVLSVEIKDTGMNALRDAMTKLAERQQELISEGVGIKQITDQTIIDAEFTDSE